MRWLAAGALLCALVMATSAGAPPAAAQQPGTRALIAFLPARAGADEALLGQFAGRGMAIGMTSPTVGGFDPRQMALDMSQGTRIPTRLYSKRIGSLQPARTPSGEWTLRGWAVAERRARKAPGDVVPGLLASTVKSGARAVSYAGVRGQPALGAIVAADEGGHVTAVSLGSAQTLARRALRAWRASGLLVADLPRGRRGLTALDVLLAARGPRDLVYVVRAPAGRATTLLPSGLAAPGMRGRMRSATTRQPGLVAAIDVAPSVLHVLGLKVPDRMQGQRIKGGGRADPAALGAFAGRLEVVSSRRGICLLWFGAGWLILIALSLLTGRGARPALRVGLLAALWAPAVALLTAALAPGRVTEAALIAAGSLGLGLLTDRPARWPTGPALPAAVTFLAYAIDLARGSPLIARSIPGPNPAGGARFFGIGNELECILSVSVLIGTGAALAWRRLRGRPARPEDPVAFATVALVVAAVMGAGRLGADVGAVITLGAGAAAAVLASLGRPPSRRAVAIAVAVPVLAVGALIVLDLVTGGGAHLTRSVLHARGSGDLADVFTRRVRAAVSPLHHPAQALVFLAALAGVVWLAVRRERLLRPLAGAPGGAQLRAGLVGAFFAVVVGTLANDSGPLILEIGAVLLGLAAAYAASPPEEPAGEPPLGDAPSLSTSAR